MCPHTNVLGVARHRNDTGEPGLTIALHIVLKFGSLGLGDIFVDIMTKTFQRSCSEGNAVQRFKQPSCELRGNNTGTRATETEIVAFPVSERTHRLGKG